MRVLFWNTNNNKEINPLIVEIVKENNISIVVLAEYEANISDLIELLSSHRIYMDKYETCCERIKLLGSINNVELKRDASHYTIQIINNMDILCCVHLNSKIFSDDENYREIIVQGLINDIITIENELNTENTMIVGDFNNNPYDESCVSARYFHGVPIFDETKRKSRKIAGQDFYMFYNPMWNFLGDFNKPYGTYYYNGNSACNTYWNIYDQVIIRPSLKERFVNDSLKIITETETRFLLNEKGHPDKRISDHLPIIYEITEENYGEQT